MSELERHRELVEALRDAALYPHPVDEVVVHETHISSVLLAGDYAYKLKKPVAPGFLDFTTLAAREHYCAEELRVNTRLAPDLYLGMTVIARQDGRLNLTGAGAVVDYAVRMRRFPDEALLGVMAAHGPLGAGLVDRLADRLAAFHEAAPAAAPGDGYGAPEGIRARCSEALDGLRASGDLDADTGAELDELAGRYAALAEELDPVFARRLEGGRVREGHGDLHLDNLLDLDGEVMAFDAIEFAPDLRWIDTANDIAFPIMDLDFRGHAASANRLRSRYLEHGGDYGALAVMPFYIGYRALVRGRIAAMKADHGEAEPGAAAGTVARYLDLARRAIEPRPRRLFITHGASASGKSTAARAWVEEAGLIQLRSDVERKRLFGLAPDAASDSALNEGIYTTEATRRTYDRLAALAREVIDSGHTPIVDATFLRARERGQFRVLAAELGAELGIVSLEADPAVLRERLRRRAAAQGEASEADEVVLERQLAEAEPLSDGERRLCLTPSPV